MKILIVAHFTRDFSETDNGRFQYLAKALSADHDVEIVTTTFSHGDKTNKAPVTVEWPFKITMLYEPGYKKNVSLKRFYSHYIWGRSVKKYLQTIEKPDVVFCAIPSLTGPRNVARYCKTNKIRFVVDIQDLWPEAFQMVFKIPVISDLVFAPFKKYADSIYRSADDICAVSQTYVDRALKVNKKCKTGTTVFLGTNLDTFDAYASENPILHKSNDEIWIAYCGTLGSSYDLTCVIDAIKVLHQKQFSISFIVMGDGPRKKEFEEYAKEKKIKAVFTGRLTYNQMCSLLAACDITVNPIAHMAAQSIINKHGDYAASGLPVVSTQENNEYRKLVEEYHMGFNCANNDPVDMAEKIEILITNYELRCEMGKNARRCAEEKFDRRNTYSQLEGVILEGGVLSNWFVKKESEFWIGYCGSLSDSYDIPCVLKGISALPKSLKRKVRFIVIGDGARKKEFEELGKKLEVETLFTGRLDYAQMCGVLVECDVVVNPIKKGSMATIINKHGDYAASGKPVINTQESIEYRRLVEAYQMGLNCENGNSNDVMEKIVYLIEHTAIRNEMGRNSRKCAEELFDRKNSYKNLIRTIQRV